MMIGDLVLVHWGNSDYSGAEGVDWGRSPGVVIGEVRYWNDDARASNSPVCGDVDLWFRNERISYNIGRCEVISESR